MKLGLCHFPTDYAMPFPELAVAAEERGFESIWLAEHSHIPASRRTPFPGGGELPKMYYDTLDPFVALSAAAVMTSRIKLATGICLVVQRDPIRIGMAVGRRAEVIGHLPLEPVGHRVSGRDRGEVRVVGRRLGPHAHEAVGLGRCPHVMDRAAICRPAASPSGR